MFITCQLIDLLLIVQRKLQAIKCALPLGNERSPGVICDRVKIKGIIVIDSYTCCRDGDGGCCASSSLCGIAVHFVIL